MFDNIIDSAFILTLFKKLKGQTEENIESKLARVDTIMEKISDDVNSNRFMGATGPAGKDGLLGASGPAGKDGKDGKAGKDGIDGKDGKDGVDGLPGPIGLSGPAGKDGVNGKDGNDGLTGLTGTAGKDGKDGKPGKDGKNGLTGLTGITGTAGKDGKDGKPGRDGKDGLNGKDGLPGKDGLDGKELDIAPLKEELLTFIESLKRDFDFLNESISQKVDVYKSDTEKNNGLVQENVKKYITDNEKSIREFKNQMYQRTTIGWGEGTPGGSVRILDNEDVEFKKRHQVEGDAILIFDADKQKFVSESIQSIMDRIQVAVESQYNKLIEVDGSFTYIGEALPGTISSESTWRIKLIETIGDLTEISWANGTSDFDKSWDNKLTYNYI
ncbi:hypothetical protein M0R04_05395 [Candidatus Dojkabacteria bacterium]|jgi:hypothetical protein|nr:hypothetical protein [Candidatus Dojkabacteria bacterium]